MNFVCSEVENMNISVNYYEFIKQMYETLAKYIKGYKNETSDYYKKISKLHEKYSPKLSGLKEELKKITNIKTNHIISLSSKVPAIISQQISNLKFFVSGIDSTIKSFEKILKEKNLMSSKYQNEYEECRNNLMKKYKDIEKSKNIFFSNALQTEDLIYKYFLSKSPNKSPNTFTPDPSIFEAQIEYNIKITKKNENDYLNVVKSAKILEDKFIELSSSSKDNMKRIACEIITKMKDNIVDFLLLLKNCFKLPLSEIDTYLPELIKLDENKKIEHIINSTYKKDHGLIPIKPEKYNIKLIQEQIENNDEDDNNNIIEEDEILNTIKKMEDNFELIEKDSNEQINNETKLRCRELTLKLLSFFPKINDDSNKNKSNENNIENNKNIKEENNNYNEKDKKNNNSITQLEFEELSKLIDNRENRIIFFKSINILRKYEQFEIPEKEFNIICDLFNKIVDNIKRENDFDSLRNILILSERYYKIEKKSEKKIKIYIQQILKKNHIFKDKEVWEDYVNGTILKEVQKHLNNDMKNSEIKDSHKTMEKKKYNKIILEKILFLIKKMKTFEVDNNIIKSIIQTLISYYKINDESSKKIYNIIENKIIKEGDGSIKNNTKNLFDLTRIKEEDEEDMEFDKTNLFKNDIYENNIIKEEVNDINKKIIINEEKNQKIIKETNNDINEEISEQMVVDVEDDENNQKDSNEEEKK